MGTVWCRRVLRGVFCPRHVMDVGWWLWRFCVETTGFVIFILYRRSCRCDSCEGFSLFLETSSVSTLSVCCASSTLVRSSVIEPFLGISLIVGGIVSSSIGTCCLTSKPINLSLFDFFVNSGGSPETNSQQGRTASLQFSWRSGKRILNSSGNSKKTIQIQPPPAPLQIL